MWDVIDVFNVVPRYAKSSEYTWPMTFHTILFTADKNAFVWLADRFAFLGPNSYGTVAKIAHLPEHQVVLCVVGGLAWVFMVGRVEQICWAPESEASIAPVRAQA